MQRTARIGAIHAVKPFVLVAQLWMACSPKQRMATLGDFTLENGQSIHDCRVGYRTFGTLNVSKSNAVLVTPWSMGTSRDLSHQIGPGKLVDSSRYYVVAVDTFGNGISSSPSNSSRQAGQDFPIFSVRDIVESQRRLLTDVLHLSHLKAVVGTSFGGMQVFQWITAYPEFMDKAITIVSSPHTSLEEQRQWRSWAEDVQSDARWKRTLRAVMQGKPLEGLGQLSIDGNDYARQAQAIMSFDVSTPFGHSLERAAAAVRTKVFVVVSERDEVVNPVAALEFSRLINAQVLVLDGRCGHRAPSCENAVLRRAISAFLE